MKIVFHEDFYSPDYPPDAASASGRMESIMDALKTESSYAIVQPRKASYKDIALAHTQEYIAAIEKKSRIYNVALLAAGGAVSASEIAFKGEPSFACIRPPGHHASRSSGWGYCIFCNMGIALLKLKNAGLINSAFVLDFDTHTGDGTVDVLSEWKEVKILNPMADNNKDYIKNIENYISNSPDVDIIGVCAGFDGYEKDVGRKLKTFDFYVIGRLMKNLAKRMGHRRRFAVLEGGYYQRDLGKNVLSFCHGFE